MNNHARIWDNALHVNEVVLGMFRGSHKEVLDIVVCPAKAKKRIRSEQRMVRGLRELANCVGKKVNTYEDVGWRSPPPTLSS